MATKFGVQVVKLKEGRAKLSKWETVIEPCVLDDFVEEVSKVRGISAYATRLVVQAESSHDVADFNDLLEESEYSSSEPEKLRAALTTLCELFSAKP